MLQSNFKMISNTIRKNCVRILQTFKISKKMLKALKDGQISDDDKDIEINLMGMMENRTDMATKTRRLIQWLTPI